MDRRDEVLASTVALGRDTPGGLEVLLVKRTSAASFAPDAWVFPGGQIDPGDARTEPLDSLPSARRAAARETAEEAGLSIDSESLTVMSRWSADERIPKRFLTWILFGRAPENAEVTIDGAEIVDHRWCSPADALDAHVRGEIALLPPTWMTLHYLLQHQDCDAALTGISGEPVESFRSRIAGDDEGRVVLWPGDAGYAMRAVGIAGGRNRLVLDPAGWRYERSGVHTDPSV